MIPTPHDPSKKNFIPFPAAALLYLVGDINLNAHSNVSFNALDQLSSPSTRLNSTDALLVRHDTIAVENDVPNVNIVSPSLEPTLMLEGGHGVFDGGDDDQWSTFAAEKPIASAGNRRVEKRRNDEEGSPSKRQRRPGKSTAGATSSFCAQPSIHSPDPWAPYWMPTEPEEAVQQEDRWMHPSKEDLDEGVVSGDSVEKNPDDNDAWETSLKSFKDGDEDDICSVDGECDHHHDHAHDAGDGFFPYYQNKKATVTIEKLQELMAANTRAQELSLEEDPAGCPFCGRTPWFKGFSSILCCSNGKFAVRELRPLPDWMSQLYEVRLREERRKTFTESVAKLQKTIIRNSSLQAWSKMKHFDSIGLQQFFALSSHGTTRVKHGYDFGSYKVEGSTYHRLLPPGFSREGCTTSTHNPISYILWGRCQGRASDTVSAKNRAKLRNFLLNENR